MAESNEVPVTGEGANDAATTAPGSDADTTGAPAELEQLRAALQEKDHQLKRALADFENYRRRVERDAEAMSQAGQRAIIMGLLDIVDNFDRALSTSREAATVESLLGGMESVRGQLLRLLEKFGAQPFESVGQQVDPQYHEVMTMVPAPDKPADTIVAEVRKGYKLGDSVLRPAQVMVAQGAGEEAQPVARQAGSAG